MCGLTQLLLQELPGEMQAMPKFARALAHALFEYVTSSTTLSGGPGHICTKEERDTEKEMLNALLVCKKGENWEW